MRIPTPFSKHVHQVSLTWVTRVLLRTAARAPSICRLLHENFFSGQQRSTVAFVLGILTGRMGSIPPHTAWFLGHRAFWRQNKRLSRVCILRKVFTKLYVTLQGVIKAFAVGSAVKKHGMLVMRIRFHRDKRSCKQRRRGQAFQQGLAGAGLPQGRVVKHFTKFSVDTYKYYWEIVSTLPVRQLHQRIWWQDRK